MKKKNKAVWGARFNNPTSKIFEKIGASIDIDKRLYEEDILGSIVHTQMLIKTVVGTPFNLNSFTKLILGSKKIFSFLILRSLKNFFVFNVFGCSIFTAKTCKFLKFLA